MKLPRWPALIAWIVVPLIAISHEPTLGRAIRAEVIFSIGFILRCTVVARWMDRNRS